MKYFRLACGCLFCLAVLAMTACKPKPRYQMVGEPSSEQPSATPSPNSPGQSPTPSPLPSPTLEGQALGLATLASSIRPAIILVTVFDASGKLLRTGTGFFVADDGRLITNCHTADGGAYGVAKMGDGTICNVTGILASSTTLDLAVLKAEVKGVSFLPLDKTGKTDIGTRVVVIGSALAGSEGTPIEGTIYVKQGDRRGDRLGIVAPIPATAIGSPVVDGGGAVIGIVIARNEKGEGLDLVQPSSVVQTFLAQITPETAPHWPAIAETHPSPRPTPKPGVAARQQPGRQRRLVYKPRPNYPFEARFHDNAAHTGRFRLSFDANGTVKEVLTVQSTGNDLLDRASTRALRQWKSEPGQEWSTMIPITFEAQP
ncbi:MAG TPA: TonB family protein [Chthoniobacterales bacterium]|nr:TonB family protein [Chthoniobacterales bacterium]